MRTPRLARVALGMLLGLAPPAAAQAPAGSGGPLVPNGESLLAWSGWELGQTVTFQDARGERYCVRVGNPQRLQDRVWVPLQGLPWPAFASDSQILLAHDGTLALAVVRTPGPRPFVEPLHTPEPATLRFLEGVTPGGHGARPYQPLPVTPRDGAARGGAAHPQCRSTRSRRVRP